jgi:hypothetical protein
MTGRPTNDRTILTTIGQIISALDDRNVLRAVRLLEPASESAEISADPEQQPRCVKCITRGE